MDNDTDFTNKEMQKNAGCVYQWTTELTVVIPPYVPALVCNA
jgi:hypothetical protein